MRPPETIETADGWSVQGASSSVLHELLAAFEETLVGAGYPRTQFRRPLARDETLRRTRALGLADSDELVAWYAWHDGSEDGQWLSPNLAHAPLSYAEYQRLNAPLGHEDWQWNPAWLHILGPNRGLAVGVRDDPAAPLLVRPSDPEIGTQPGRVAEQMVSLCTPVTWWIEAIEAGWSTFHGTWWSLDRAKLPPERHSILRQI